LIQARLHTEEEQAQQSLLPGLGCSCGDASEIDFSLGIIIFPQARVVVFFVSFFCRCLHLPAKHLDCSLQAQERGVLESSMNSWGWWPSSDFSYKGQDLGTSDNSSHGSTTGTTDTAGGLVVAHGSQDQLDVQPVKQVQRTGWTGFTITGVPDSQYNPFLEINFEFLMNMMMGHWWHMSFCDMWRFSFLSFSACWALFLIRSEDVDDSEHGSSDIHVEVEAGPKPDDTTNFERRPDENDLNMVN
jgi:hypothetical protein